jgi:hypothetical protein
VRSDMRYENQLRANGIIVVAVEGCSSAGIVAFLASNLQRVPTAAPLI